MTLNSSRTRLWHALQLGPIWQARSPDAAAGQLALGNAVPASAPSVLVPESPAEIERGLAAGSACARLPAASAAVGELGWEALALAAAQCQACDLCVSRTQVVFGVGKPDASWLFVGEAPGAEEDARGEPFVGAAGRLLDQMLLAAGLGRDRAAQQGVYIANVLKCRPPGNRNPQPDEVAACLPFLERQIALLAPRIVVVMGRFAAQALLATDASIASLRGRVHYYAGSAGRLPLIVTYHPAYLLRNLADKAKSWEDLCLARTVFDSLAQA